MPFPSLTHAWPLWLLGLLPLLWFAAWRHRTRLNRRRMTLAVSLRSLALAALVLALGLKTSRFGTRRAKTPAVEIRHRRTRHAPRVTRRTKYGVTVLRSWPPPHTGESTLRGADGPR